VENLLFYVMAAGAVGGALGVVLARNPIASVLSLLACFFCLATIYLLAGFQFLAAAQILVYAGAIMVLFLFVIMLLNLGQSGPLPRLDREMFVRRRSMLSIAVAGTLLLASAVGITALREVPAISDVPVHGLDAPLSLATSLFGPYALPFEATSLLLLATAVAVVVLAKRTRIGDGGAPDPKAQDAGKRKGGAA
jgi:NADH-quinone oxidoreductase subunit J